MHHLAFDLDFDGRLGEQAAALAVLDHHHEVDQLEGRAVLGVGAPQHHLDRGFGGFEGVAPALEMLDALEHLARARRIRLDIPALGEVQDVAATGELRDHGAHLVADRAGIDVLVALRALEHGRHVDAALVGERALPDIGEVVVMRDVRDLGDVARELGELAQALRRDAAARPS